MESVGKNFTNFSWIQTKMFIPAMDGRLSKAGKTIAPIDNFTRSLHTFEKNAA